jgi:hypothetical protein
VEIVLNHSIFVVYRNGQHTKGKKNLLQGKEVQEAYFTQSYPI